MRSVWGFVGPRKEEGTKTEGEGREEGKGRKLCQGRKIKVVSEKLKL